MSIQVIEETKFKNITISLRFRSLLSEESMNTKMIVSDLLSNVCAKYPDKQSVTNKLDTLYGASLSSNYITYGKTQVIELRTKIIQPDYIDNNEDLIEEILELMKEFVYHPKVDDNGWIDQSIINESKRIVMSKIVRTIDEPGQYASLAASIACGEGFPLGIQIVNQLDKVKDISQKDITNSYLGLRDEQLDIIVIGDVNETIIKERLMQSFPNITGTDDLESSYVFAPDTLDQTLSEKRDISQSYISMIFKTEQINSNDDYWKLMVANSIFGQTPSSLLFREVREKHSLCYSISSGLMPYDGAMIVNVGVDPVNTEKTISLIKEQFERVRTGDFNIEILDTVKEMLSNMFINQQDDIFGILNFKYRDILTKSSLDVDDVIKNIRSVTLEDVKAAFNKCSLVMTYQLGKGE